MAAGAGSHVGRGSGLFPDHRQGGGIHRMKVLPLLVVSVSMSLQAAPELRFCLRNEPKTFDPALVEDEASETIRYLTGGVLMRVNRLTQELEPELALSWKVTEGGRAILLRL